ncbi:esterase [Sphaerisporangium rufum]|uniref:Esterase n=1 Tax=Sphaerisporangium rufum TaxID=1381558 RepID=A0A919R1V1_9ACTN|nr:serine hydrolase domain-containing protein [Sphaerisporangium rufum]GII78201.1 esterase [Sphaerisporangium rufum]
MITQGHCDPRFARVREVFERQFADGRQLGASFAVHLHGEPVVDLWGGVADRHTGRPWERGTPALAYSCTKAVTATVLLMLIEDGLADPHAPVAGIWPEFAARGKDRVTLEQVLSHQAGLPAIEDPVPVEEYEDQPAIAARLAAQAPLWEPGTAHGYHALSFGFLAGEIVRRLTGGGVGEFVAGRIAGPRDLELWVGAPDDVAARAALLSAGDRSGGRTPPAEPAPRKDGPGGGTPPADLARALFAAMTDPGSLMNRATGNPSLARLKGGGNHPLALRAGWPAMGLVTTARGLAGFYRDLIGGVLVPEKTLAEALRPRVAGPDRVLLIDSSFALGYLRPSAMFPAPPAGAATAFGHTGLGGSLGLGDPRHGLAMAHVMNRMARGAAGDLRAYELADAVYGCVQ